MPRIIMPRLWRQMYGEVMRKAGGSVSPYFQGIYILKHRAADILERICEKEDLGIFQSVVLGDKSSLEEDTRKLYQRNGISHLLAVSGLHISMISLAVYGFFRNWDCLSVRRESGPDF